MFILICCYSYRTVIWLRRGCYQWKKSWKWSRKNRATSIPTFAGSWARCRPRHSRCRCYRTASKSPMSRRKDCDQTLDELLPTSHPTGFKITVRRWLLSFIYLFICIIRSSAVAVKADRTAYDVRYTDKLSNRFRLQVFTNGWYARSNSTGRVYEHTQTLSTQAWPLSVTDQSSVVSEVKTTRISAIAVKADRTACRSTIGWNNYCAIRYLF